jgi:hypothetical protein
VKTGTDTEAEDKKTRGNLGEGGKKDRSRLFPSSLCQVRRPSKDSEDIYQNALLKALQKNSNSVPGNFPGYYKFTQFNDNRKAQRDRKAFIRLDQEGWNNVMNKVGEEPDLIPDDMVPFVREVIKNRMGEKNEKFKKILEIYLDRNYTPSFEQVAEELGISEVNASRRYYRALEKIRIALLQEADASLGTGKWDNDMLMDVIRGLGTFQIVLPIPKSGVEEVRKVCRICKTKISVKKKDDSVLVQVKDWKDLRIISPRIMHFVNDFKVIYDTGEEIHELLMKELKALARKQFEYANFTKNSMINQPNRKNCTKNKNRKH